MDYLQYSSLGTILSIEDTSCFKPCYKWITFNTKDFEDEIDDIDFGFKPCYKWITFNTILILSLLSSSTQCFKPCYKWITFNTKMSMRNLTADLNSVLNLVINGLPSILVVG